MPLNPTVRRRLTLTKDLIPTFIESWAEIFEDSEDEQYDALVDQQRAGGDERQELFRALEASIPPEALGLLQSFDAAWTRQADAREDTAYLIGAAIGQTRRCSECQAERERSDEAFAGMLRGFGRDEDAARFLEKQRPVGTPVQPRPGIDKSRQIRT